MATIFYQGHGSFRLTLQSGAVFYIDPFAGDTSTADQMATFASRGIDYAFLPGDGVYNMDISEAIACAELIGAKHTVPVHIAPGKLFDGERAKRFLTPSALIIRPGEERAL